MPKKAQDAGTTCGKIAVFRDGGAHDELRRQYVDARLRAKRDELVRKSTESRSISHHRSLPHSGNCGGRGRGKYPAGKRTAN